MTRALNFGSLNLDYVYRVDHFVRPGETLDATTQVVNPGGKGLNQSIALARAGAAVWHAGCVGVGGASLAELLHNEGVDTTHLANVTELQGNAVIQVVPSGQNAIVLFGGSNRCIASEQVEQAIGAFDAGDWLVLQNEVNALGALVECAYAHGLNIALNPSPYNEALEAVDFGKLSWLFVNEVEARQISGSGDPEEAWRVLHEQYPRLSVLITLGDEGSVAYQVLDGHVQKARQDTFSVEAVDTTGAGDTYTGFFVGALMEGLPLATCMRRASMAAALSVTRPGAATSIPTLQEVLRELDRMA